MNALNRTLGDLIGDFYHDRQVYTRNIFRLCLTLVLFQYRAY